MAVDDKAAPNPAQVESKTRTSSEARPVEPAPGAPSFWRRHRFSLAGLAVGLAIICIGAFVVHDLRRTHTQIQQLYARSVRNLDRVGDLQYQMQEGRRYVLSSLAALDSKGRVESAGQARAVDARVVGLIQQQLPGKAGLEEAGSRLLADWDAYEKTRDEELVSHRNGPVKQEIGRDL